MFSRILVPLDQTFQAEHAIPVAAHLARTMQGEIVLTHVLSVPLECGVPVMPAVNSALGFEQLNMQAERYLHRTRDLPALSGVRVLLDVTIGSTATAILDTAKRRDVDMIVMTRHGRTGSAHSALGPMTHQILRHAQMPVLIVREQGPQVCDTHGPQVFRALIPLDGSARAEQAVDLAAQSVLALARIGQQSALTLARIVDPSSNGSVHLPKSLGRESATLYLERITKRVEHTWRGVRVSWLVLSGRDVAATLVRLAEQGAADGVVAGTHAPGPSNMIIMTTHGRTGIARLALGSIAERVLEIADLPLLVVRSSSAEGRERDAVTEGAVATTTPVQIPV